MLINWDRELKGFTSLQPDELSPDNKKKQLVWNESTIQNQKVVYVGKPYTGRVVQHDKMLKNFFAVWMQKLILQQHLNGCESEDILPKSILNF
jgi:hypothetical protein